MKFRVVLFILLITAVLSACNMSLAEDVTPPPGYVSPTPLPTLVMVPPQIPNIADGKAIYAEKCAPCHGDTGLGDGDKGIQLGVTVPAFALPEVARPASPAAWFTTVTRGKMDRFMPPFVSLNDQQRWDVVAYIMTLHTSEEEIQRGKQIFEENCPNCSLDYYKDLNKMSGLSTVALARIVRLGNDDIQAFGENLSDADMWAVAEYLRSLSYDNTPLAAATAVPATSTPVPAEAGTPSGEATPVGTQQVEVPNEAVPGFGTVRGSIENKTGGDLPTGLTVTLRGYEHDFVDPNAGTQEVVTMEGTVADDGTFTFDNVEMPEGRIFLAEVTYMGLANTSDFAIVEAGQTSLSLPLLDIYDVTTDLSGLVIDEMDMFLSITDTGDYEVLSLYSFRNTGESIINVEMGNSQEIPFLKFPSGVQGMGYEALQDSAPFTSTDNGFAMSPSDTPYGILAVSSVTDKKNIDISQELTLPVSVIRVLVPDGMEAEGVQLTPDAVQDIQGDSYQSYFVDSLQAGDTLSFKISGSPKNAPSSSGGSNSNTSLLIGAGGLGLALILAGAWMYLRDKRTGDDDDDEDEESEFETAEDVMDAIIALDDLHRANKIADEAYQRRRAELKDILKDMM